MKPVDIVVLVLVVSVGFTICLPLLGMIINDEPFDEKRAKVIGGLVASAIAVVSMYVGSKLNDRDK